MSLKALFVTNVFRCLSCLPLSFARACGVLCGQAMLLSKSRGVKVTTRNIERCFPDLSASEQRMLIKKSVCETAKLVFEVPIIWGSNEAKLRYSIKAIHGEQYVRDALLVGKGLIILAPHHGNWEVLGRHLVSYAPVTNLYQPPKQAYLEGIIKKGRERSGANVVPTTTRGIAKLMASLRKGHISGILPDQVPDQGRGEFASFFGQQAYTMSLLHGLIQRTECRVVVGIALRVNTGFELHFSPADEGIYSVDKQSSIAALNRSVEHCVNIDRSQYQWEYKRFRRQPKGSEHFYRCC